MRRSGSAASGEVHAVCSVRSGGLVSAVLAFAVPPTEARSGQWPSISDPRDARTRPERGAVTLVVVCRMKLESPHFSRRGGTVAAKARVICASNGPGTVTATVSGSMSRVSGGTCVPNVVAYGPGVVRWSARSKARRIVLNDPEPTTFYLPTKGSAKLTANSSWYAVATLTIDHNAHGTSRSQRFTGPSCP